MLPLMSIHRFSLPEEGRTLNYAELDTIEDRNQMPQSDGAQPCACAPTL